MLVNWSIGLLAPYQTLQGQSPEQEGVKASTVRGGLVETIQQQRNQIDKNLVYNLLYRPIHLYTCMSTVATGAE